MSILDEIRKLDEKKAKLLDDAKAEALKKAKEAISMLGELGFNYRLVEGETAQPRVSGKRRTGIREDVLSTIKAHPNGIARAELLEAMNMKGDKSGEQSVSNALAALKKAGTVTAEDGNYKVAP